MVGSATLGLVVPGAVRKQAKQVMESKPVRGVTSQPLLQLLPPGSCLEFLPWLPLVMDLQARK